MASSLKPPPQAGNRKRIILWACYVFLAAAAFLYTNWHQDREAITSDYAQYMSAAYKMARYGVCDFSTIDRGRGKNTPASKREPGYPFFLAAGLKLLYDLEEVPLSEILSLKFRPELVRLKFYQLFWSLAAAFVSLFLVKGLTKSNGAAYTALFLVTFSATVLKFPVEFATEGMAAGLLTFLGFCLFKIVSSGKTRWYAAAGICLGILTLTRAVFLYFFPLLVLFLLFSAWRNRGHGKQPFGGIILLSLLFLTVTGAWMVRNHGLFGKMYISDRGGEVLLVRSTYNMMTPREYAQSFYHWVPLSLTRSMLRPFVFRKGWPPPDESRLLGDTGQAPPDGYRKSAYRKFNALIIEHKSLPKGDAAALDEAKKNILAHPFRHLAVTLPLSLRGMFAERRGHEVSFLIFLGFFALFGKGLIRRDLAIMAPLLPAVFSFCFYALLSDNVPRFNRPLVPLAWSATVVLLYPAMKNLAPKIRSLFQRDKGPGPEKPVSGQEKVHDQAHPVA